MIKALPSFSSSTGHRRSLSTAHLEPQPYRLFRFGVALLLLIAAIPGLVIGLVRIPYSHPIHFAYNEGWNVIHTARLLHGELLYQPLDRFPLIPVNYPPLSFVVVGAVSRWSRSILSAGRAVAYLSFLGIGWLLYRIVADTGHSRIAAVIGALYWFGVVAQLGAIYLGYDDPQFLAMAISLTGFWLYWRWRDQFTWFRVGTIAVIVSLALFVKHVAITVPITITLCLLIEDRKTCTRFIVGCGLTLFALLIATYLYAGGAFFDNFLDVVRRGSMTSVVYAARELFAYNLGVVIFPPAILLSFRSEKDYRPALIYFAVALVVATMAQRGVGVGVNAWFDLFVGASLVFALFVLTPRNLAFQFSTRLLGLSVALTAVVANEWILSRTLSSDGVFEGSTLLLIRSCQLLALLAGVCLYFRNKTNAPTIDGFVYSSVIAAGILVPAKNLAIDVGSELTQLNRDEEVYRDDVARLRAIPGPALFENLLLGYDAGKEVIVDPFNSAQLTVAGRIPERLLLDKIRHQYFGGLVVSGDVHEMLTRLPHHPVEQPSASVTDRWTDRDVAAFDEFYEKVSRSPASHYTFYVPKNRSNSGAR